MKLNVRFNSNLAVKQFVAFGRSGSYFRVIQEGRVRPGDVLELQAKGEPLLSVFDVFQMIYERDHSALRAVAKEHPSLAESTKLAL